MKTVVKEMTSDRGNQIDVEVLVFLFAVMFGWHFVQENKSLYKVSHFSRIIIFLTVCSTPINVFKLTFDIYWLRSAATQT
jgi:hypothetical protein